jgi:lantibiotic biosynthesis protein
MFKLKNYLGDWFCPHDSFVVRSPLMPVNSFFQWKCENGNNLMSAKQVLRNSMREFFMQPLVQEALYIASRPMHEQLQCWLDNKIKDEKLEKTEHSLIKYMTRMSSRCTPFGLFATCTAGVMGEETNIQLSDKDQLKRFARLDMDYVCELHKQLLEQRTICNQLSFFPNNSLYRCGSYWRYIEYRFEKEKGRSYHLVEITDSPELEKILISAQSGLKPEELAAKITDDEIPAAEALAFIYDLINSQVLRDALNPAVTGEEYFAVLLKELKNLLHTGKYVDCLNKTTALLEHVCSSGSAEKNSAYSQISEELQQLEEGVQLKSLVQVDCYRPASACTLNRKINDEILKGIGLLKLLAGKKSRPDPFADFKNAFRKRYDGQWIPLVEVLDTEWGIGFGKFTSGEMDASPLIDKLPVGNSPNDPVSLKVGDTESFKWELYLDAISKNKTEVRIDDKVIEQLSKIGISDSGLPDSFSALVKINSPTSNDIDTGNYTLSFQSVTGPSGGNLLGRFCHLHPEIENLTRHILKEEEANHPDCIFAEIVHLPESRTGNILMRPVLRKYEIPYLCNSVLDKSFQIPVSDLLVGIEDDKVTLRSGSLNKVVIPRLTTAHNFNLTTLPVYQFLCETQYQGIHHADWQWGALRNCPFLPRVSYGRFILSHARWILTKEEIAGSDKKNDEALLLAFSEIRKQKNLPDYVRLTQGDNELVLHLENIFCIRLLLSEITKSGKVILTEMTDMPDQCWLKSPEGNHAAEFIVAFTRKRAETAPSSATATHAIQNQDVRRIFPVGSEWLSAKIYCGTNTAEKLLTRVLKPFTEKLYSQRLIDKFFFLRYFDEGHHIRIRFHNSEINDFWEQVISQLQKTLEPCMQNSSVYNLQFEIYRRETERYGFDTMELSEDLFWHHSKDVMNVLPLLDGDEGEEYRWQIGLKAIDILLEDFCYTTEQKYNLIRGLNQNFSKEFGIGHIERKIISERFNGHKKIIQVLMGNDWQKNELLAKAIPVFTIRTKNYLSTVEAIRKAHSVRDNTGGLNYLMQSYLHMFINRLFVSNQRKTEMVIYEYLLKHYESGLAREKMKVLNGLTV